MYYRLTIIMQNDHTQLKLTLLRSWWRHQKETFFALLAICAGNSPVTGEFPAQRPVTRSFEFSLICTWINGWANNREAGGLRRHRTHYDVTVMCLVCTRSAFTTNWLLPVDEIGIHQCRNTNMYFLELPGLYSICNEETTNPMCRFN